jgi:peptidoglycan hydrolase-like protein with peptidoglycan-binding domain
MPKSRRRILLAAGTLVVAAALVLAAKGFGGGPPAPVAAADGLPPATAKVVTADLVQTEHVSGTLSYGTPEALTAPAKPGTITWLPPAGAIIKIGQPVYKIDQDPLVLIKGTIPPYRELKVGVSGSDVKQLEQNLAAFGYTGFKVDNDFTAKTKKAVKKWQEDLGVEETGKVDASLIVVAPGDLHVGLPSIGVGDVVGEPNLPVLTVSGAKQKVTVALDVAKQHLVKKGGKAKVTLPDGKAVAGTVTSVAKVATQPEGTDGQPSGDPTITVEIVLADPKATGGLDAAPVDVSIISAERKDVLTVPITALVALAEGGYGVQLVDGTSVSYVKVQPGMFADGKVEISGAGVAEGTVVGVPT